MAIKTFTAGSVLTASDTNTYLANSGLVYITTVSFNSLNTTINNCFSSAYDNYRIIFTSTGSSLGGAIGVYMRPNGVSAGYGGSILRSYGSTANAIPNNSDIFLLGYTTSTSHQFTAQIDLISPYLPQPTLCNFQSFGYNSADNVNYAGGENLYTTGQYTNLLIGVFTGTVDAKVTIYGYRKA